MLLQAKKEFLICADIKPEDVFFYYTTTFVIYVTNDQVLAHEVGYVMQGLDDVEFPHIGTQCRMHSCTIRWESIARPSISVETDGRTAHHYIRHQCEIP